MGWEDVIEIDLGSFVPEQSRTHPCISSNVHLDDNLLVGSSPSLTI